MVVYKRQFFTLILKRTKYGIVQEPETVGFKLPGKSSATRYIKNHFLDEFQINERIAFLPTFKK